MGGITNSGRYSKAMFELTQSIEWTRLEQTLQIDHWATLAIPIPDELVYKKVELEDKEHQCSLVFTRKSPQYTMAWLLGPYLQKRAKRVRKFFGRISRNRD